MPVSAKLLEVIRRLKSNDPQFLDVDLTKEVIGNDGAIVLAEAIRENHVATKFFFNNCGIGLEGARALGEAFRQRPVATNNGKIAINMASNPLTDEGVTEFLTALGGRIENDICSLTIGNRDVNKGGQFGINAIEAIAKFIKTNNGLTSINLASKNLFTDDNDNTTATKLALLDEAMRSNSTLKEIVIDNNKDLLEVWRNYRYGQDSSSYGQYVEFNDIDEDEDEASKFLESIKSRLEDNKMADIIVDRCIGMEGGRQFNPDAEITSFLQSSYDSGVMVLGQLARTNKVQNYNSDIFNYCITAVKGIIEGNVNIDEAAQYYPHYLKLSPEFIRSEIEYLKTKFTSLTQASAPATSVHFAGVDVNNSANSLTR